MRDQMIAGFVITCIALVASSNAGEKWISSNSKGELGNLCEIEYKMPDGFINNKDLAAKQNAITILSRENSNTSQFIALDYKSGKEAPVDFEGYRKNEKEFLKQYKVEVNVEILQDEHFIKN